MALVEDVLCLYDNLDVERALEPFVQFDSSELMFLSPPFLNWNGIRDERWRYDKFRFPFPSLALPWFLLVVSCSPFLPNCRQISGNF